MVLRSGLTTQSPSVDMRCGPITSLQDTPRSFCLLCHYIITSCANQTELTAWAGCLADQQLEFSDKNYSVTVAGVWSRLEVSLTVM